MFTLVMDELTNSVQVEVYCMLFVDYVVLNDNLVSMSTKSLSCGETI